MKLSRFLRRTCHGAPIQFLETSIRSLLNFVRTRLDPSGLSRSCKKPQAFLEANSPIHVGSVIRRTLRMLFQHVLCTS